MVRISNGWGHEPNAIDHPNTEHVRYSSPHCSSFLNPRLSSMEPALNFVVLQTATVQFNFQANTHYVTSVIAP